MYPYFEKFDNLFASVSHTHMTLYRAVDLSVSTTEDINRYSMLPAYNLSEVRSALPYFVRKWSNFSIVDIFHILHFIENQFHLVWGKKGVIQIGVSVCFQIHINPTSGDSLFSGRRTICLPHGIVWVLELCWHSDHRSIVVYSFAFELWGYGFHSWAMRVFIYWHYLFYAWKHHV